MSPILVCRICSSPEEKREPHSIIDREGLCWHHGRKRIISKMLKHGVSGTASYRDLSTAAGLLKQDGEFIVRMQNALRFPKRRPYTSTQAVTAKQAEAPSAPGFSPRSDGKAD